MENTPKKHLIAYRIPPADLYPRIVPASPDRFWMDFSTQGWANRCLPLRMANANGWHILNDCKFEATWTGKPDLESLKIRFIGPTNKIVQSCFGYGIITWFVPYLFRTPAGINILSRGPANFPKNAISPLEGLVETDWSVAPFTVNWKFTRPNTPVRFDPDDPICLIVPQERSLVSSFQPEILEMDEKLNAEYTAWDKSRIEAAANPNEAKQGHYTRGETVLGTKANGHQTKLNLSPFEDRCPIQKTNSSSGAGPAKQSLVERLLRRK